MTLQEAIEFLEDLQPDVCENCTMSETCDNAGTGICVEALNILKAEALHATDLQAKIDSGELVKVVHGVNVSELHPVDEFECSECGVILEGYSQVIIDDHDNDRTNSEYKFLFCPNCGAKINPDE